MRNILQLVASMALLATQVNVPQLGFGNVAAAAEPSAPVAGVYEVKLNIRTATAVAIVGSSTPDYNTSVLQPLHEAQAQEAVEAAQAAQAQEAAARETALRLSAAKKAATALTVTPGTHSDWMREAGIASADFGYADFIISHESGWGVTKSNHAGSGAYGLGQAFPARKMAAFGSDYLTDPVTQLKWANAYATSRYGSWANAYSHWILHHSC
jgi:hypothetical protein